jgi:hypothetical protein
VGCPRCGGSYKEIEGRFECKICHTLMPTKKPTYEELEKKIKHLEVELEALKGYALGNIQKARDVLGVVEDDV